MMKRRIHLYVTPEELELLDQAARQRRLSRSGFVRLALRELIDSTPRRLEGKLDVIWAALRQDA